MVNYKYNAWGNFKILNASGAEITDEAHIGFLNPFRYRGYYYSDDLGLYYLKSRFYDPEVGRFISADTIDYLAPDAINGLNLYAYCGNNPVMNVDPSGHKFYRGHAWLNAGSILGWLVGGVTGLLVKQTVNDVKTVIEADSNLTVRDSGSIQIPDSYKVVTPWVQWGYSFYLNHIREDTKYIIGGTTTGAQLEWLWHNLAFYGFSVADWTLQKFGVTQLDEKIEDFKESARSVDLELTVFSNPYEIFGITMRGLNFIFAPIATLIDLFLVHLRN